MCLVQGGKAAHAAARFVQEHRGRTARQRNRQAELALVPACASAKQGWKFAAVSADAHKAASVLRVSISSYSKGRRKALDVRS